MPRIETVLCPVDFFPASDAAVDYAIALAKSCEARLILLHVVEPIAAWDRDPAFDTGSLTAVMTARATEELNKLARRAKRAQIAVEVMVRTAFVDTAIDSVIRECKADFVVVGTHGRRGLEKLFIGSTTERLLRKIQVPLLTIRRPRPGGLSMRHIMVATDFSDGTADAIHYAMFLAKQYRASVTLLHVLSDLQADLSGPYREPLLRSIENELQHLVPPAERDSLKITIRAETGRPSQRILPLAQKEKADLIVLNIHGKNLLDRLTTGTTAEKIVRSAPIPVLLVPAAASARRHRRARRKAA